MLKLSNTFFGIFIGISLSAQFNPSVQKALPNIVPPSPEAASIGKYGLNPIGLYTGTVNYTYPIYNIAYGSCKIPISLSYSSNGLKIDEVAGRVGMQWKMDFGGVINRTIIGSADEECFQQYRPVTHDTAQWGFYQYLLTSGQSPCGPFHPDQYSYSFPGYSGKFILTPDSIVQIPYNILKIQKTTFGFQITTPDGNNYFFGDGATELSKDKQMTDNSGECNSDGLNAVEGITSWYLRRIVMPTGHLIEYVYEANEAVSYLSGINQSFKFQVEASLLAGFSDQDLSLTTCIQQLEYSPFLLKEIRFGGSKVVMNYSQREDIIGEKKLDSIAVYNYLGNKIKTAAFNYRYAQNSALTYDTYINSTQSLQQKYPHLRKRLFLEEAYESSGAEYLSYKFDYDGMDLLPPRLSYAQDYWGYFNGRVNSYYFPANTYGGFYNPLGMEMGGDRDGQFPFTQRGILKKITYPTGGFTEYNYEPTNTWYRNYKPKYDTLTFTGTVNQLNNLFQSQIFTINPGIAKISFQATAPALIVPGPNEPQPTIPDTLINVSIINTAETLNNVRYSNTLGVWRAFNKNNFVNHTPLTTARLLVSSFYDQNVNFTLKIFNPIANDAYTPTGWGVKVNSVKDYGISGETINTRSFKYSFPYLPEAADWENFSRSPADEGLFCAGVRSLEPSNGFFTLIQLSSSSAHSLYNNDLGAFSFPFVTEEYSDTANNISGGVEHRYLTVGKKRPSLMTNQNINQPFSGILDITLPGGSFNSYPVPGGRLTNTDLHDGKELETNTYILQTGIKKYKNSTKYYYSIDNRWKYADTLYNLRMDVKPDLYLVNVKYYGQFNVSKYNVNSSWMHLDSMVATQYESTNDSISTRSSFVYNNFKHMQPTQINSKNSKNFQTQSDFKYPHDFMTSSVYNGMVSKNIVSTVIEQTELYPGTTNELSKNRASYAPWHSSKFYLPIAIEKSFNGLALETDATVNAYDTAGNMLQTTTKSGGTNAIIWGYRANYPIAQITNATYAQAIALVNQSVLDNPSSDAALRTELNKLRTGLPNALVTTFTYAPLIGITSQTDPNGKTTTYRYDPFARLMEIKDHNNNIIKKYCYNYAGQAEQCY